MRLPVPQQSVTGMETMAGVAAVAALVALPTGIPLSEVVASWLPALPEGSAAPLLVGAIWVAAFGWFWAGVRGWLKRTTILGR